jgi:hypothetical protein
MKSLNIRKKLVTLAVASVVSGGAMMAMTAPAHAMNVSQNNVGEVLLFPYYTVKNGFDTVFTVTNTSDRTAIFKVRFREALNSREVRDFNVILSPYDHWSAGVTSSATGGALVRTFDNTCTSPTLPASSTVTGAREVAFTNALYTAPFADGGATDISRVQEGYFEVILMGLSQTEADTVAVNAKHTAAGVPLNCALVDPPFLPANLPGVQAVYDAPENVLKGHVVYINVANGTAIDAEPTAIENFQNTAQIIAEPGDLSPSLASGDFLDNANMIVDGVSVSTAIAGSVDRVSALLRADSIINEFATGAGAATSWVVTMPTKHHYTDSYTPVTGPTLAGVPSGGFSDWFYTDGLSCDNVEMGMVNREEGRIQTVDNTQFSPYNPSNPTVALCYEANVIDFNSSSVFGTGTNRLALDTSGVGTAGWATLTFTEDGTFGGLPAIGFAAIVRDAGGAAVNYGSSIEHTFVKAPLVP